MTTPTEVLWSATANAPAHLAEMTRALERGEIGVAAFAASFRGELDSIDAVGRAAEVLDHGTEKAVTTEVLWSATATSPAHLEEMTRALERGEIGVAAFAAAFAAELDPMDHVGRAASVISLAKQPSGMEEERTELQWSVVARDAAHLDELSLAIERAAGDLETFASLFAAECDSEDALAAGATIVTNEVVDSAADGDEETSTALAVGPTEPTRDDPLLSTLVDEAELEKLIVHVRKAMAPYYATHLAEEGADAVAAYHVARYLRYLELLRIMKDSIASGATRSFAARALGGALEAHLNETRPLALSAKLKKERAMHAAAQVEEELKRLEAQVHVGPEEEKEQLREFVRLRERLRDSTLFAKGPAAAAQNAAAKQRKCLAQLGRIEAHLRQQLANAEAEVQSDLRAELAELSFADLDARVQRATARLRAMEAAQRRVAEAAERSRKRAAAESTSQHSQRMIEAGRRGRTAGGDARGGFVADVDAASASPRRRARAASPRKYSPANKAEAPSDGGVGGSADGGGDLMLAELQARAEAEVAAAQESYAQAQAEYGAARHRARKVEACLVVLQSELTALEATATHHDPSGALVARGDEAARSSGSGHGGEGTVQQQMARLAAEAERADATAEREVVRDAAAKLELQLARQHELAISELKRRQGKRMADISALKSAEYERRLEELTLEREAKEADTAALNAAIEEKRETLELAKKMRAEQEELIDQQMRLAELRGRLRKQWAEQRRSPEEIKDFLLYVLGFRAEDEERALTERAFTLPLQRSKELLWRCRLEVRHAASPSRSARVHPSIHPSIHQSIHPSIHPPT